MKQVLVLTKMQLGASLDFLNFRHKKDRKKNLSVTAMLLFGAAIFAFVSGSYGYAMGQAMMMYGQIDVLPGFFMAATSVLTFITSICKAKGVLFGFKDYDMLMSLPVKASRIVESRLLQLYIINMVMTVGFMVPCYAVYGYLANPKPIFYVYGLIAMFFIPFIPMILASILGVLFGLISSRFKFSNVVNTIVMIIVFIVFFFANVTVESEQQIAELGTMFQDKMNSLYPLSQMFLDGVVYQKVGSFLIFLAISVLAFLLFSIILGKCFKKVNTLIGAVHSGTKYKMKELKQKSTLKALYFKELKRYFTCFIYVFNTGFALILMLIVAVGIHVAKIDQIEMMVKTPLAANMLLDILPFGISAMAAMCAITASSISLEGKNLWILKAAPVKARTIFGAKILLQFSLTGITAVITAISLLIKFNANVTQFIITIALSVAYCYLTSVFGLVINLKLPMMEWKNETVVVKQSAASMLTTFGGFGLVGIPIVVYFAAHADIMILSVVTLVVVLVCALLMNRYINKNGDRILASI